MRLKTYTAESMARAMDLVRRELGDDAIIVATQSMRNGQAVRVTAAIDEEMGLGTAPVFERGEVARPPARAAVLGDALAFHGVGQPLAERLLTAAGHFASETATVALGGALDEAFLFQPISERLQTRPLMLIGPPGVGKTIACAKLMMRALRCGRAVRAISTDTKRAGGIEQLQAFCQILKIDLAAAATAEALIDAAGSEMTPLRIIDTAGVNPFNGDEVRVLGERIAAIAAEPVLVLAAGGDAAESADVAEAFVRLGVRRVLCTRLDVARRLGGLLAAADAGGFAFSDVSISPQVAEGLAAINPVALARLLLPSEAVSSSHRNRFEASA
jgi:flagellar biosynthesis protein FlhF